MTAPPRLDVGFEAALDGDRARVAEALVHDPLIDLMTALAARIQEVPTTSQAEVCDFLIPAVSAWVQVERGWIAFDDSPLRRATMGAAAAQFLGSATESDNPVLASFACHIIVGYLAGEEVEDVRSRFLKRISHEKRSTVDLDAVEAAPARGENAVSWMIDAVGRYPGIGPTVLADGYEARFGISEEHSQAVELLRLLGYDDIWKDPRSGFLSDCLRATLRLGDAAHSTSPDDLRLSHADPTLPHSTRDEEFAAGVLHALTQRLTCLLTPDRALRMPQTADRYLLLARLSTLMADVAIEQRTKDICAAMLALAEPQAAKLNRAVHSILQQHRERWQAVDQRARRKYLAFLVGWIPVTVLWSYVAVIFPGSVQHVLWPVFIWLSTRTLRSLAKFRAVLGVGPSVSISLLYLIGYVVGRDLVDNGAQWSSLVPQLTLGTVLAATSGFLVALVSVAYPKRVEQTAIEVLPEGLPDDWQDSAHDELSRLRRGSER